MKIKIWLIAMLILGAGFSLQAQDEKIGYANMELLLSYMPESQEVSKELRSLQQKMGSRMQIKEQYAQSKLTEYQEKAQAGATEADLKPLEEELRKLDKEIQKEASDSEYKLMQKRQELLQPLLEKLQAAISKIADEKGFTFVVNTTDSEGKSIVIKAPEEANLNEAILKELGIELPNQGN